MKLRLDWTEDYVDELIRLAAMPLSADGIAVELSKQFSIELGRNAVIGKLKRMGVRLPMAKPTASGPRGPQTDLAGRVFGRLTVVRRDGSDRDGARWLCKCLCGSDRTVPGVRLRSGHTRSCGCMQRGPARRIWRKPPTPIKQSSLTGSLVTAQPAIVPPPYQRRDPLPLVCEPVGYMQLRDGHCRWLVGGRDEDDLPMSCGAGTEIGSSWCSDHRALAY